MCVFGSVHLMDKKVPDLPFLSVLAVGLVRGPDLQSTVQRVTNMQFESECLTWLSELACSSSESYTYCTRCYGTSQIVYTGSAACTHLEVPDLYRAIMRVYQNAVCARKLLLCRSTGMCIFGSVHLVDKKVPDLPYLCKQVVGLVRGSSSRRCTGQCSS